MLTISACAWALPQPPHAALQRIRSAGFEWIDVRADCWDGLRTEGDIEVHGLRVACAGLHQMPMPPGASLDLLATRDSGRILPYLLGGLERGALLGARWAYIVAPAQRPVDTDSYARSMARLADAASALGVRLCIEPTPGRALGTAAEALRFVETVGHSNLYTLLDLGHCLLTGEDPAAAVRAAGDRLGYVHIDDNDGRGDCHWPLFDGILEPPVFEAMLDALVATGYCGPVSIELAKRLGRPLSALCAARDALLAWQTGRQVFAGQVTSPASGGTAVEPQEV